MLSSCGFEHTGVAQLHSVFVVGVHGERHPRSLVFPGHTDDVPLEHLGQLTARGLSHSHIVGRHLSQQYLPGMPVGCDGLSALVRFRCIALNFSVVSTAAVVEGMLNFEGAPPPSTGGLSLSRHGLILSDSVTPPAAEAQHLRPRVLRAKWAKWINRARRRADHALYGYLIRVCPNIKRLRAKVRRTRLWRQQRRKAKRVIAALRRTLGHQKVGLNLYFDRVYSHLRAMVRCSTKKPVPPELQGPMLDSVQQLHEFMNVRRFSPLPIAQRAGGALLRLLVNRLKRTVLESCHASATLGMHW
jgi:hypothetical protein